MIIYYIVFMLWLISLCNLLTNLEKNNKSFSLLKTIQLYNFLTGFLGYFILGISFVFFMCFLRLILSTDLIVYIGLIFTIIPLLLLIIPINIKVKKKIDMNKIGYIALSITMLVLGFGTFIIFGNYIIELIG